MELPQKHDSGNFFPSSGEEVLAKSISAAPHGDTRVAPFTSDNSSSRIVSNSGDPGDGIQLLGALWRSPDRVHEIGTLDMQTRSFRNVPVNGVSEAVACAFALSNAGVDAYFACAEYQTPNSCEAAN